jgi:NAD(P)-dependent dehydrogenase (short-subunit alcohol dehydrogenase family)
MAGTELTGKVAIVTGGGRGMALARAGALGVTATSAESGDEIKAVARQINYATGRDRGLTVIADVADAESCARAVAPHTVEAGQGRIINISKSGQSMIGPRNSPYGPSMAAPDAMTLIWAQDLSGTGARVNAPAPGGLSDTTFSRPSAVPHAREAGRLVYAAQAMAVPAAWLASGDSPVYTGCRFNAANWDDSLPAYEAAEAAREVPIFAQHRRQSPISEAWAPPGGGPAKA